MSKIRLVVVGKTNSVYFTDDRKIATLGADRLMEYLVAAGQWTFNVDRTMDPEAVANVKKLGEELKADIQVTGDKSFKFKVKKEFVQASTAPTPAKTYIRLGKDAIFDNAAAAFEHARNVAKQPAPAGIMVGLTKTFERGSVEGQIKSVFSDVITYGVEVPAVAKKVLDFAELTSKDARYDALRAAVADGASAAEGSSVNSTFKYLYLVTAAKELAVSTEEAPAADDSREEDAAVKAA